MMGDDALADIMSSKPHKLRNIWVKDRAKILRIVMTVKVVRVLVKLRKIQRDNKSNKVQMLFDFN